MGVGFQQHTEATSSIVCFASAEQERGQGAEGEQNLLRQPSLDANAAGEVWGTEGSQGHTVPSACPLRGKPG